MITLIYSLLGVVLGKFVNCLIFNILIFLLFGPASPLPVGRGGRRKVRLGDLVNLSFDEAGQATGALDDDLDGGVGGSGDRDLDGICAIVGHLGAMLGDRSRG